MYRILYYSNTKFKLSDQKIPDKYDPQTKYHYVINNYNAKNPYRNSLFWIEIGFLQLHIIIMPSVTRLVNQR